MAYVKDLICKCKSNNKEVSDVHLHVGDYPYVRIQGEMIKLADERIVTENDIADFMLDINFPIDKKQQLEENGSCDYGYEISLAICLRVNFYYQRKTLSVAVRCLDGRIPDFAELGLPDNMKNVLKHKSGLVIVTGLTGNGKSTTIASLVDIINKKYKRHIITIEDPIEYRYLQGESLVSQREVGVDCTSFADGLREALRQDPDVIVIGEMRDKETIKVTMEAAESGHLVFSTLHTYSAANTVDRLISYFANEEQEAFRAKLANVLIGVFTQKLVARIGTKQRVPAYELMFPNIPIKALIRDGKIFQITNYMKLNSQEGNVVLEDCLASLVANKVITKEDALLNCNDAQMFQSSLDNYIPRAKTKK